MAHEPSDNTKAELMSGTTVLSLEEVCIACSVDAEWVAELVEYGAVEVRGPTRKEWQFASVGITRVSKAKRLRRDLDINAPGVALALDLLDEIERLRAELRVLRPEG